MFDIGGGELAVIAVVALIAIGPKELPGVLRMVGQWVAKARGMARDFQNQFQEAMREADVAEMKRQFDETVATATNPSQTILGTATKDITDAFKMEPVPPENLIGPGDLAQPAQNSEPAAQAAAAEPSAHKEPEVTQVPNAAPALDAAGKPS